MTVRAEVDELISWYEANKPEVKQIPVTCRPGTLHRFAKKIRRGPFVYRDRELIPVRPAKKKPEQLEIPPC